jgi:hypothetical protein
MFGEIVDLCMVLRRRDRRPGRLEGRDGEREQLERVLLGASQRRVRRVQEIP